MMPQLSTYMSQVLNVRVFSIDQVLPIEAGTEVNHNIASTKYETEQATESERDA